MSTKPDAEGGVCKVSWEGKIIERKKRKKRVASVIVVEVRRDKERM